MPATNTADAPRNALFPIFLDLAGKTVLVVGGGQVATRKVQALLDTGADICVGAPELDAILQDYLAQKRIRHLPGKFTEAWLDNVWLVIAATDERATNLAISQAAQARRIWVNFKLPNSGAGTARAAPNCDF
jgi:uroporphyrin-III C-methyltransferase / precorrin-2 dehydrogenase / sirohydrochlorin ferrochelatase